MIQECGVRGWWSKRVKWCANGQDRGRIVETMEWEGAMVEQEGEARRQIEGGCAWRGYDVISVIPGAFYAYIYWIHVCNVHRNDK